MFLFLSLGAQKNQLNEMIHFSTQNTYKLLYQKTSFFALKVWFQNLVCWLISFLSYNFTSEECSGYVVECARPETDVAGLSFTRDTV